MLTIAQKELKILFCSPLAWVVLALAQVVFAWMFLAYLDTFLEIQPQLVAEALQVAPLLTLQGEHRVPPTLWEQLRANFAA